MLPLKGIKIASIRYRTADRGRKGANKSNGSLTRLVKITLNFGTGQKSGVCVPKQNILEISVNTYII